MSLIICAGICFCHLIKWDPSYEDVFPAQLEQAETQTTGSREEPEKWKRRVTFPPICSHTCWCFRAVTLKGNPTALNKDTLKNTEWPLSRYQKDTASSLSFSLLQQWVCLSVWDLSQGHWCFSRTSFPLWASIELNGPEWCLFCRKILRDIKVDNISIVNGILKGPYGKQDIQPLFEIKSLISNIEVIYIKNS